MKTDYFLSKVIINPNYVIGGNDGDPPNDDEKKKKKTEEEDTDWRDEMREWIASILAKF